jgi:cell division protein FtsW
MHPERTAETTGYQLYISKLALGSGGLFGQGFMCSRMKAKYLPEAHTDFILSVVGEEFGYVGIIAILCAYAYFCYLAYQISLNARNKLGMFLGCGLTTFIALQALINLTVIGGLAPTKGMPAPFISYGGTNLLSCVVAVGILLSIASDTIDENYNSGFYKILNSIISLFRGKNGKKSLQ